MSDKLLNIIAMCDDATAGNWPAVTAIREIRKVAQEAREAASVSPAGAPRSILVDRDADLLREMCVYLDTLTITGDTIGDIRRSLFVPWNSAWNGWVRAETAAREKPTETTPPAHATPIGAIGWDRLVELETRGIRQRFEPTSGVTVDWVHFKALMSMAREAALPVRADSPRHNAVTRFEVIDHRLPEGRIGIDTGRVYSVRGCQIALSYQDGGTTLKVFIDGQRPAAEVQADAPAPQDEHRAALRELVDRCRELDVCLRDPEANAVDGATTRAVWRRTVAGADTLLAPSAVPAPPVRSRPPTDPAGQG